MWRSVQTWRGIALIGTISAVALWLAASGQLVLYIHPRYVLFTVAMAIVALVLVVAAIAARAVVQRRDALQRPPGSVDLLAAHDGQGHDHAEPHDHDPLPRRRERALGLTAAGVAGLFVLGMVLLPPATLSTATAEQREINATAADVQALDEAQNADAAAVARFTVREWAGILRQTSDLGFFADKPVTDLVGFVSPDADDPENVFYVSRFSITCCAVDAQPLGVPVHLPGWQEQFPVDSWVSVSGEFVSNPSAQSLQPIVIEPSGVEAVEQPREPYLF
ncbi:TIGR03943 family protein [Microcella daejeonensis]|uniref:TIGR03943 family protein n=1 Tax=Microcella daejeonensis TaxID=2994971 RepID=A0A9E8ML52_9MICO|nr:TIGR03943 family protein [Microcella daejeonensis]WAB81615.1 TIGR03943 family protein [Microcella daejeonensis]